MREIVQTSHFKGDLKKLGRSGRYNLKDLLTVIEMLATGIQMPKKYLDHPLSGECEDYHGCHIRFDWLLLYRLETGRLILVRSGSHAELYR